LLHRPTQNEKYDADQYLRNVADNFVLDIASGIYKPKAYYKKTKSRDLKKTTSIPFKLLTVVLSALTLLYLVKYTNYARLQWIEAKRTADQATVSVAKAQAAIDLSKEQFVKDQRPYIWNTQIELPHLKIGDKVTWNYHYANFGKSPAIGVAYNCQILLAAHKTRQKKNLFSPIHDPQFMSEGFVVPPGDLSGYSTCESDEVATQADIDMHNVYDAAVGMKIFYEYSDTGGNVYTSRVCMFLRRTPDAHATRDTTARTPAQA
jgi:hypothetical protein